MERRRLEGDRLPAQEVPLFAPSGTVALRKQRVDGAEQLVEAQAIRVAPPPLGPVSLGQDVVGVVLKIAGRVQAATVDRAVIEHPPGAETLWDWVELPDPPTRWGWISIAYVLIGALPHSGRWRGWLAESTDQPHLVEGLDAVTRRLGGLSRRWRFDRMSTMAQPQSGRLQCRLGRSRAITRSVSTCARPITHGARARWKRPPG